MEKLISFGGQVRMSFNGEAIKGLSKTILEHGIRQPLSVIQSKEIEGRYEVVSGERRLRAAKLAGLLRVPCQIIQDMSDAEEIALIENVQREDLHPIELGRGYLRLKEKFSFTQENIADKLGIPRSQVAEFISFSKIPDEVSREALRKGISSRELLRDLVKCRGRDNMMKFIENVIPEKKNVEGSTGTLKRSTKKQSVIRVALSEDSFVIQKRKLSLLSELQRLNLKELLQEVLDEL